MPYTYLPKQIEIGEGSLGNLGEIARKKQVCHLFIVIDAFLLTGRFSYQTKIEEMAEKEGLKATFFSDYRGEPTTEHVKSALNSLQMVQADCVIAIGGGSAIDLGKAIALFARNPQMNWENISSYDVLVKLPLIAVPTTAGTGSEATKVMVIKNNETGVKMNPGHKDLIPDVALLDPRLTTSLPKHFTAYTGMDALTHAMEAFVSTKASVMTDHYASYAISMIGKWLEVVYNKGNHVDGRKNMLLASCYAGIAFSNASTNLAHAAGRSLGARFEVPHGLSVSLLLPFVMEFTMDACEDRYAEIALLLGANTELSDKELAQNAVTIIEDYNDKFKIWEDGATYIDAENLKEQAEVLALEALEGNGITTNRKIPNKENIEEIYVALSEKLLAYFDVGEFQ
ncbi:iron-containing alcohol dehydrogenase [Oceanobacillus kimchii]|uniref:iron-containing alcohol dehydrogenase n=1 Tax=Oceanobacillus kimchii TaxID=746691 RepID=UPI003B02BA87